MDSPLAQPLTLPCGLQLPNRLVKAAMAEKLADGDGLPTPTLERAYEKWGGGGWGLILTGNVQVDHRYLNGAGDVTMKPTTSTHKQLARWCAWASACTTPRQTPAIVQLNHPGRQSPMGAGSRSLCAQNLAPSAVPLDFGPGLMAQTISRLVFGVPRAMTEVDIQTVVQQFVDAARLAAEAGFQGVETHAAHGYLLAQFLSASTNRRTDAYGGTAARRAQLVVEIIRAVRAATPPRFCVGIKLNSVDHQSAEALEECVEQLRLIVAAGVDFVEISGGSYEKPTMMMSEIIQGHRPSARTEAREAFFLDFASAIRSSFPEVPLMVTGGFRTRQGMIDPLQNRDCDMIGLGRPAVLHPTLPVEVILNKRVPADEARLVTERVPISWANRWTKLPVIGAGDESWHYSSRIAELGG
ncbi:NADH:flavin oxidoreductase/NADH oxidase family protein [Aspergillus aculeatinus CBS 121060]|uniref:FMN binding oxidoreductase n=1 Tax=Aspergillus aculeatinus CBS 121060 TaxID=1448322 RepID=A0ACD1H5G2_9EURO|nr:FMN binding oxidoreductase [Aspergillus aculeatinus CBS 121060]RAH68743.1 FMN binding oxidoreductase [Aspergillus aculeatinus CBS 121060]